MKPVIVGPGAMGCLFAGFFSDAGQDVWLLDKDPARADIIARNGVRIDDERGSRVVRVHITADPARIGVADLLFLCVKSYDTASAVESAILLVKQGTIVVSLQNGFGNVELLAAKIDGNQVLCAITSHGSTLLGPGHVRHAGVGPTSLAPFAPDGWGRARAVADLLTGLGLEASPMRDIQSLIWSKLIVNAAVNPLTAIANVRNGRLLEDAALGKIMREAAREAAGVARAKGVALLYEDEIAQVESVCRLTRDNFSSMLQDSRRGRKTEIDAITGVIVKEARTAGIKAPVNEMLLERVRSIEGKKHET